ncbi:MAG: bifunctional oligoribonuclease/PAP phosphatase NrnA [Bdellovibrionales bacterium]|nr:bifunctional oligoribonuclease/PAP phosphatase NrnA [Bdellovibrionales bacterium]
MMLDFTAFKKALEPYSNIAITAPAGADGDSVGTQCSMQELLQQIFPQKKFRIVNEEPCPTRYLSLPGSKFFEVSADILRAPQNTWPDCMICVDGGANRIGEDTTQLWNAAKERGQIDHHAIGRADAYGFRLYDPKAAATTEIVFKFARALNLKITPTIAQAIYVGLVFDTGLFKHNNTRPETLRIAAELLEVGFDHTTTIEETILMRSAGALKMLRSVLSSMNFDLDGRYVWAVLDNSTFHACGGSADDREGLIDSLFLTRGCEIAGFFFERNPGEWKVSFRARGWDVATLAKSLNPEGGGHKLAAGCTLTGTSSQILSVSHEAVKKLLQTRR